MQMSKAMRVIGSVLIGMIAPFTLGVLPIMILFMIGSAENGSTSDSWIFFAFLAVVTIMLGGIAGLVIGLAEKGLFVSSLIGLVPAFTMSVIVILLIYIGLQYGNTGMKIGVEIALGMFILVLLISLGGIVSGFICGLFVKKTMPPKQAEYFQQPPPPPMRF